jgi:hypothetical protein
MFPVISGTVQQSGRIKKCIHFKNFILANVCSCNIKNPYITVLKIHQLPTGFAKNKIIVFIIAFIQDITCK